MVRGWHGCNRRGRIHGVLGGGSAESFWIRIKGQTNHVNAITGAYYRPTAVKMMQTNYSLSN